MITCTESQSLPHLHYSKRTWETRNSQMLTSECAQGILDCVATLNPYTNQHGNTKHFLGGRGRIFCRKYYGKKQNNFCFIYDILHQKHSRCDYVTAVRQAVLWSCETPVVKYQVLWFRFQKIFGSNTQKKHCNWWLQQSGTDFARW